MCLCRLSRTGPGSMACGRCRARRCQRRELHAARALTPLLTWDGATEVDTRCQPRICVVVAIANPHVMPGRGHHHGAGLRDRSTSDRGMELTPQGLPEGLDEGPRGGCRKGVRGVAGRIMSEPRCDMSPCPSVGCGRDCGRLRMSK